MSFKVAIYSYNRCDTVEKDTINTLLSKKIKPSQIYIFVANETQKVLYEKYVDKNKYNKIVVGRKGKNYQINFVRKYFKQGEKVLNVDDDIIKIVYKYRSEVVDLEDLYSYSEFIFKMLKKYKTGLAGPILSRGASTLKHKLVFDFHQINGGLYWTLNNKNPSLNLFETDGCEDMEFSIKCWKLYGKVLQTQEMSFVDNSRHIFKKERKTLFNRKRMKKVQYKLITQNPQLYKMRGLDNLDVDYSVKSQNRQTIKLNERKL